MGRNTSVGLVAAKDAYQQSDLDIEDFFVDSFRHNAALEKAMSKAKLINDIKGGCERGNNVEPTATLNPLAVLNGSLVTAGRAPRIHANELWE